MNRFATVLHSLVRTLIVASIALPYTAHADVDDVVLLWGTTTEHETMFAQGLSGWGVSNLRTSVLCERVTKMAGSYIRDNFGPQHAIFKAMWQLYVSGYSSDGEPEYSEMGEALNNCIDGDFDPDLAGTPSNMWLIYSSCSMTMGSGAHIMRWTVPPLAEEAEMTIVDLANNQAFTYYLETSLSVVGAVTDGGALGNLRNYDISGPSGSRQVTLRVDGQERDFQARAYDYSYQGDVNASGTNLMAFQTGRIDSEGQAWIVADAPGTDVVSLFYQNFSDHVRPAAGIGTMIEGMIKQMADLTRLGIPVRTKQKIKVFGSSFQTVITGLDNSSIISAPAGAGTESESESTIDRIAVVPGAASQTCGATVIPESMETTNMNQMMAGAMGGGSDSAGSMGGANNPMASPEYQEAMQQMEKEMANLTPQERQMMEQFGLGSMFGGVAATDNAPDTTGSTGTTALARGSNSAGAGNSNAGSAKVSSADLMSDDLLESVQKHLDALGYNPGNTDGTTSVMTEVAISQFQAENNMTVTGKVTPQLLGILSAAVDK